MYFKGTIVITDPCYIIKENPIKCPNEEDFEGEVEYYIDEEAHIVGTGSINFYTAQTGI